MTVLGTVTDAPSTETPTTGTPTTGTLRRARPGTRFAWFSLIGGAVFLGGLALQAVLTGALNVPPVVSYIAQAVVSVEASFLLNRSVTWRDRDGRFWPTLARFNLQKSVTIGLNLALYAFLLRLGVPYLLANIALTGVFTVVNYTAGDRLVFRPAPVRQAGPAGPPGRPPGGRHRIRPGVSVVIPCRDNQDTIRPAVLSLLDQDYRMLREIIVVGSPGDPTFGALEGIGDERLICHEIAAPPGIRDANFKRDIGVRLSTSELVALVDSDIVLPSYWVSRAVAALEGSGASVVAGGMRSAHDSFWGRFTDSTLIGAKTPRVPESYLVTSEDFGTRGRKPPITANTLFPRALYRQCPIDPQWSHGSYEDYEWFWRITKAGHRIQVCRDLFGWHQHRRGLRAVAREYRRSSRGCAYFIREHRDSPLARRRLGQVIAAPLAALAGLAVIVAAVLGGYGAQLGAALLIFGAAVITHQVACSRRLESVAYPLVGAVMGVVFTVGLVTSLLRPPADARGAARPEPVQLEPVLPEPVLPATALPETMLAAAETMPLFRAAPLTDPADDTVRLSRVAPLPRRVLARLRHPLTAILAVQAAMSLSLVWSNTASNDEADYLWTGHLVLGHWLHGAAWPAAYGQGALSGSPLIYPPLGALADSLGGLAAARILSLLFMLGATALLWLCARRLFSPAAASFAAALWAVGEPALKLGALATYDAMSVFLAALAAWLAAQAVVRRRRGELVAASGLALSLAVATAYSGVAIAPVVIGFAVLTWQRSYGYRHAGYCAGWLAAVSALGFFFLLDGSRSWRGLLFTVLDRQVGGTPVSLAHIAHDTWTYTGLIGVLGLAGAVLAAAGPDRGRRVLVAFLAGAVLVVPVLQGHGQTAVSLDKHLAYGAWFAAMAAGYLCAQVARAARLAGQTLALAACCGLVLAYPAATGLDAAWHDFRSWDNSAALVTALAPAVAQSGGDIYVPASQVYEVAYYLPQGRQWTRWRASPGRPFGASLRRRDFGTVALFYTTSVSASSLTETLLRSPGGGGLRATVLSLVTSGSSSPGLIALTRALESDPDYRLVAVGPDNNNTTDNVFAIWQKVR